MRDFHLRFYGDEDVRWYDGMMDLLRDDLEAIPEKPGVYVIGSSDGTNFIYPWGRSPVFYIGQSQDLRSRLAEHKKWIEQAIEDHEAQYWWPRYQFGAAFGATVAWYTVRGTQNPHDLEADVVDNFYWRYGSLPIANGAWPDTAKKPVRGGDK